MFCETEEFKRLLRSKENHQVVLVTSEFVSCISEDDNAISDQLSYWRNYIFSNLEKGSDSVCSLNKGNVLVLLEPSNYMSFCRNLQTSYVTSKDQKSIVLRFHVKVLDLPKTEFILSFF